MSALDLWFKDYQDYQDRLDREMKAWQEQQSRRDRQIEFALVVIVFSLLVVVAFIT